MTTLLSPPTFLFAHHSDTKRNKSKMYLLTTDTCQLINVERELPATPAYAILSHRWGLNEITFEKFKPNLPADHTLLTSGAKTSAAKIKNACAIAKRHNLSYLWIDSVCIDKSSSEELSEAIQSMFTYYHEAAICYTYLSDVTLSSRGNDTFNSDLKDRQNDGKQLPSVWFERGWTLQELLAPRRMAFYDKTWRQMGTRHELASIVAKAAHVDAHFLTDSASERLKCREVSVATKMSWMAGRVTTRPEDIAYSLLGLLDINMIPVYGEGIKAFSRLQDLLMKVYASFDESLFAWARPANDQLRCYRKQMRSLTSSDTVEVIPTVDRREWGLLAPSPDCFQASSDLIIKHEKVEPRLAGGFQLTHQGINVTLPERVLKILEIISREEITFPLNCWRGNDRIILRLSQHQNGTWSRMQAHRVESKRGAKVANNRSLGSDQGLKYLTSITIRQPKVQLRYAA